MRHGVSGVRWLALSADGRTCRLICVCGWVGVAAVNAARRAMEEEIAAMARRTAELTMVRGPVAIVCVCVCVCVSVSV